MAYFSDQTSIETRASSGRLELWADKNADGTPDSALLTAAEKYAQSKIYRYTKKRFGETELLAWQTTTPDLIAALSDDLCVWYLTSSNPAVSVLSRQIYLDAIAELEEIRDGNGAIYGVDQDTTYHMKTQASQAVFDDELTTRLSSSAAEEETFSWNN